MFFENSNVTFKKDYSSIYMFSRAITVIQCNINSKESCNIIIYLLLKYIINIFSWNVFVTCIKPYSTSQHQSNLK